LSENASAQAATWERSGAGQNRRATRFDMGDHLHALQHAALADEADHRLGIVFENDRLL